MHRVWEDVDYSVRETNTKTHLWRTIVCLFNGREYRKRKIAGAESEGSNKERVRDRESERGISPHEKSLHPQKDCSTI